MECSENSIKDLFPKKNNITNIIFPLIKDKKFDNNFDSFIFGYLLGNLLKDKKILFNEQLIDKLYIEYQKQNKLSFETIYTNLNSLINSNNNINNNINNLNIKKEDSDNFNLFIQDKNNINEININNKNCIFIDINSIDNYSQNTNNNIINEDTNKKKESIISPEDYEDYNKIEEEKKGKCLICLEEYFYTDQNNYYLDCGCIIHSPCFDNYIENAINNGKVPIKCPYCNKKDINELDKKDSLNKNNKHNLIEKFDKFLMNYFIMQHPEDISCCPTPGCKYIFI